MAEPTLWARLRCKWSGHTDHVVFKQTGHIFCGRCQAMCPPGTNLRGDVTIHLSAIDAMRGAESTT